MEIKIFLFHRVHPVRDTLWDPIDPFNFRQIIDYLSKNFFLFKLEDLIQPNYIENLKRCKKPPAAIVFDDGYYDFIQYALPILDVYKAPTSMYVITDSATSGLPPWTYILDYTFTNTRLLTGDFDVSLIFKESQHLKWNNPEERIIFGKKLKPLLKKLSHNDRKEILNQIHKCFDDVNVPENLFMNWQQIREIALSGVEIGSHTISHPLLGTIEDTDLLYNEITRSGEIIRDELGKFPVTISYPVGSYNDKVKELSRKAGYLLGLAVKQHSYTPGRDDDFEIPRIELYNESFFKTKLRTKGVIYKINKILRRSI